ncbi:hypothetical protein C2I18_18835 [Paenibacillus sp. PK3_47]|uniref:ABC transporter ATP-binding protein n=1 Tax=Paenibacillus sp. PK3_47 TaxID=2072642 RepID=UPI00201E2525|nr:ABC transporter ATP-binding protein [Paenibacillus sp. PK3_47]UQZ35395.1 hypothetical protein C2I18_18835 [Paenibacillus sp. PK3_47]
MLIFVKTIIRGFAGHRLLFAVFLISSVIEIIYAAAAPLSLQYLVDDAFVPKDLQSFIVILMVLLAGGLLNLAAAQAGDYSLSRLAGGVIRQMRAELFGQLQRQSSPFYERYRTGDLISRFIGDMSSMEQVIRVSCPLLLRETGSTLLGLVLLFSIEWKLTLAVLAGASLMFIAPRLLLGQAEKANRSYKEAQERFSNIIDEAVRGQRTIRSLHQQDRIGTRADLYIGELFRTGTGLHRINSLMERLPQASLLLLNGIMISLGGYFIFRGDMTIGGFMAFFTLFMSVGQAANNLSFLIPNLIDSTVSFTRIRDIMNLKPEVPEAVRPVVLPSAGLTVEMDGVTFGYGEGPAILQEVSLSVPSGSYVALVGLSGSGKTTALRLLARFHDPQTGTVRIGGTDLREVSEASLRKELTLVTQDTFLFQASIRENLLLDHSAVSEEIMHEAARAARIHETIMALPEGYDTLLPGEGGPLSGGQRQRLALARALLRSPQVLLLDEITSALDAATEADISRLLLGLRGQMTIISVTHRLASTVNADRIYVFHEGRIAESGTHAELLRLDGIYSGLWEKQHGFRLGRHLVNKHKLNMNIKGIRS